MIPARRLTAQLLLLVGSLLLIAAGMAGLGAQSPLILAVVGTLLVVASVAIEP